MSQMIPQFSLAVNPVCFQSCLPNIKADSLINYVCVMMTTEANLF